MATLKIPKNYESMRVLLADDEPEHLDWLVDYLSAKGLKTTVVTTIKESVTAFEECLFRAYIIDLNIPLGGWSPSIAEPSPAYSDYHGLYALKLIRSQGNSGGRVLAYSAHYNDQIVKEIRRLYCKYVVKGRPLDLKTEIDRLLKVDPKKTEIRKKQAKVVRTGKGVTVRSRKKKPKRSSGPRASRI